MGESALPVKLVCGLGNPGAQYSHTRHNVGWHVIDILCERWKVQLKSHPSRTLVGQARIGTVAGGAPGPAVDLAKAQSFMNVSGGPLARLAQYLKLQPQQILVIHDDLDLPEHALRLKSGGGEGGHNGLKSLSANLGSRDYLRLRIGIGRPPGRMDPADYVLAPMRGKVAEEWAVTFQEAADVVEKVVLDGFVPTQQELHSAQHSGR